MLVKFNKEQNKKKEKKVRIRIPILKIKNNFILNKKKEKINIYNKEYL